MLEVASAAAGLFLLIEVVGGAIMWARFRALDLPAGRGVSLLSPEYLLSVGTSTIFLSFLLGLLAVVLLFGIRRVLPPDLEHWAAVTVALMLEVALVGAVVALPLSWQQRALAIASGLLAGLAFTFLAYGVRNLRRVSLALLFGVALVGGVLGFIRNYGPPAKLELAFVFLKEGGVTSGAYVGASSDEVFLAPDSFNRTYGQIVGIPRRDVVRMSFSKPQDFRPAGARDPRSLLGAAQRSEAGFEERVTQVEKYFGAWAGDPVWKYPPISFLESEAYLRGHLDEFFSGAEKPWKGAGLRVRLEKLVEDARGYSGQALITRGRVLQTVRAPSDPRAKHISQFLTLAASPRSRSRVLCGVTTRPSRRFPEGREVEVRGVVVAAGSFAVASGAHVSGAFLQCSAARLRPAAS